MRFRPHRPHRRLQASLAAVTLLCAMLLGAGLTAAPLAARAGDPPSLDAFYRQWPAAVAPWMLPEERDAYAALTSDLDRDLFIHAFWRVRGRADRHAVDGPWDDWGHRLEEARAQFDDLQGDRAQAMMIAGVPDQEYVYGGCRGVVRPLRVWRYNELRAAKLTGMPEGDDLYLVFARDYGSRDRQFSQWDPASGIGALAENDAPGSRRSVDQIIDYSKKRNCFRTGDDEARILRRALTQARDSATLRRWIRAAAPDAGWLTTFRDSLNAGRLDLPADYVAVGFPGADGRKTLTLGRLRIPAGSVRQTSPERLFDRLVLTGEAWLGDHAADRFQYVYHLAGQAPDSGQVELDFYRRLRPGQYRLRLRLEDDRGLALLRRDLSLRVPEVSEKIPENARRKAQRLTQRRVVSLLTFPSLTLVPPGENLVGEIEVRVTDQGGPIHRVEVLLDGRSMGSDLEAPYSVMVDLGPDSRRHLLEAVAYSEDGEELARDALELDPVERPFGVRITSPTPDQVANRPRTRSQGEETDRRWIARAQPSVPRDGNLESVRFFLDRVPLGERSEPPFEVDLPLPLPSDARFLRVTARLADGAQSEALLPLDPLLLESVDVRWVEIYAGVEDASGRPITDLTADRLTILEDGVEQDLARFTPVKDLPIQVALAMDTSVSMRGRLGLAAESARHFFATVMTERDQAALLTFNHDLRLVVPFTSQIDRLRLGAGGLTARGGTRLHDALAYAAAYFNGHSFGTESTRRALVLLSDGRDVESQFSFERAQDQLLRAGVAVYPILLSIEDSDTRSRLESLAAASGGRAFSLSGVSGLDSVYARIEEDLRSQYLLVYAADDEAEDGSFRRIELRVDLPGAKTRSIRGYYR